MQMLSDVSHNISFSLSKRHSNVWEHLYIVNQLVLIYIKILIYTYICLYLYKIKTPMKSEISTHDAVLITDFRPKCQIEPYSKVSNSSQLQLLIQYHVSHEYTGPSMTNFVHPW